MIVSLFADRRTSDVAVVAHDLAVALSAHHQGQSVSLFVDRIAERASRGHAFVIQPQPLPVSVAGALGGLRPVEHAVLAFVGSVTELVITAFDLSARILVVTDTTVPSLRSAQRAFRLCRDVGYRGHRVMAVLVVDESPLPADLDAVRAALRGEEFCPVPRGTASPETRRAAFANLAARVARGVLPRDAYPARHLGQ